MDLDVRDLRQLETDLRHAEESAHERGARLIRACTLQGEALSKVAAPVRTGLLKSSIDSDVDAVGSVMHGEWGSALNYAGFVNRGTSRMSPRPFIDPAFSVVAPVFHAGAESLSDPFSGPR